MGTSGFGGADGVVIAGPDTVSNGFVIGDTMKEAAETIRPEKLRQRIVAWRQPVGSLYLKEGKGLKFLIHLKKL